MKTIRLSVELSPAERELIKTLIYFDLFSYPLTLEEIYNCSEQRDVRIEETRQMADKLAEAGLIFQKDQLWGLSREYIHHQRRIEGNRLAAQKMPDAFRISRWIGFFPFVRAVFLSGSISKYFMTEESDIDYFIITKPGRLWIARTLLVLFKKIFLFNSHKYFCVNYFIDTQHLEIEEKNRFTATEIVHLIPAYGKEFYPPFMESNGWVKDYFPNFPSRLGTEALFSQRNLMKRLFEILLGGKAGDWLDGFFMKKTVAFWNKKFGFMDRAELSVALKSRTYVSKHHPQNFQRKVLEGLEKRIKEFEQKHGIELI
ncbi:MAG: nucleotidyltransferase domain-containing protein [Bacteroidia bacterium]|nr:nucleotidyltransferase domain-containing protein [Bacteroidia bacterium]